MVDKHTKSAPLDALQRQVMEARGRVHEARQQGSSSLVRSARADHRVALERYAAALVDRKLPVPPALRDELRLDKGVVW
jgi:hypothetical protein